MNQKWLEVIKIDKSKTIKITVQSGVVVEVEGLPPGYDYEINDLDVNE